MRHTEPETPRLREAGFGRGRVRWPGDVAAIAAPLLQHLDHERVLVVACDAVGCVIATVAIAEGQAGRCRVPVREVMRVVLVWGGCAFALAHNHPSGDPEPSPQDVAATRAVAEAARVMGLRFFGHVVVSNRAWTEVNLPGG